MGESQLLVRRWRQGGKHLWAHYRWYVLVSGLLFGVGIVIGTLLVGQLSLQTLFGGQTPENAFPKPTVGLLIRNNAIVVGLLVASVLTLGLAAVAILVYNGVIVGYVGRLVADRAGIEVVVLGFLPHGVVEIPAFLLASGVALRASHQLVAAVLGDRESVPTATLLRDSGIVVVVALVLIVVAAVIEAEITLRLVETIME